MSDAGDFVGVDPERLDRLATQLERLRDAIGANAPVILNGMSEYDTGLNLTLLRNAIQYSVDDAAAMRTRAQMADNLQRTATVITAQGAPPVQIGVMIPWDEISSGSAAQADAQLLQQAESDPNSPQARAEILSVEADIQDHMDAPGGSAYLAAFYNYASPQVAALARTLDEQDGASDVLSAQDAKILKTFAAGLAEAATSQNFNLEAVSRAFTRAPDMWSSAIFFKYATGSAFASSNGTQLLAGMSRAVLTDAANGDPSLAAPIPDTEPQAGAAQQNEFQKLMAEYDPVVAVIGTTAGNPAAAQDVLGGPNGENYAKDLLNYPWNTGGAWASLGGNQPHTPLTHIPGIDTSAAAAAFLNAATAAPGGIMSPVSAQAVINIVNATAEYSQAQPGAVLPHNIRLAFIGIAQRNAMGFGISAPGGSPAVIPAWTGKGSWAEVSKTSLKPFLAQALNDPSDFGRFQGYLNSQIPNAVTATVGGQDDYLHPMADLYGLVQQTENGLNFDTAEKQAAQAAYNQMMVGILTAGVTSAVGAIPLAAAAAGAADAAAAANAVIQMSAPAATALIPTGDAAGAVEAGIQATQSDESYMWPLVVQGLINAHAIPSEFFAGKDGGFYDPATGTIKVNSQFWDWVQQNWKSPLGGNNQSVGYWIDQTTSAINSGGTS